MSLSASIHAYVGRDHFEYDDKGDDDVPNVEEIVWADGRAATEAADRAVA